MPGTEPTDHESPDESAATILMRLNNACGRSGIECEIIEPSTRMRVNLPHLRDREGQLITLAPDDTERLCFWWNLGGKRIPICFADAGHIGYAVMAIKEVLQITPTRA